MLKHLFEKSNIPNRVVILGSAGFVGAACQQRLETLDIPVLSLPRTKLDLTEPEAGDLLARILRTEDSLLFVSAKAPVKTEPMLIDNLRMASAVCGALKKTPVQHLVYISSDAIYDDSDHPLNENSCTQPSSLHGVMHLAREVMLANAWLGPACFLRPTLIYGTEDPHNGYGPNRFIRLAKAGEDILLFGEGEERRDHVWINDVAYLICRALCQRSVGSLNIATGRLVSFYEIAEKVIQLIPSTSRIKKTIRAGKMPHNGYRAFDPSATYLAFPSFRYTSINTGIGKMLTIENNF